MELHGLGDLLQHARWLVEVDRHRDLRQVLADAVFDDLPEGDFAIWVPIVR